MSRKTYIGFFADADLKRTLRHLAKMNERTMSQELRAMIKAQAREMEDHNMEMADEESS